jgi:hypothetical protein
MMGRGRRGEPPAPFGMRTKDEPGMLTAQFGPPDTDVSNETTRPTPIFVLRRLTYTKEHVTAVYRQDGASWSLVGFVDPETSKGILTQTAAQRLESRRGRGR